MKAFNENIIMQRCLELALKGAGMVNPNPMVGCVIARNGKIVGEGFHQKFGGPHAEIFALKRAGKITKGATLYVSLEPCAHFGKTPPCTEAIIQAGISQVVIASKDPNPLVSGKGIRRLRRAGIHVKVGLLQKETELLNEKFFKYMRTGLPFVGIKLAQTLDGRIADIAGKSKWITSKTARKEVHRLRNEYDAVLVGANTVLQDNPELTVRLVRGRNPVRVVVDGRLSLPVSRAIFNTSAAPTWVLTSAEAVKKNIRKVQKLVSQGVCVFSVSSANSIDAESMLRTLAAEGVSSVLIEGGAYTVDGFVNRSLADKLYLFVAPKILGDGLNGFCFKLPRLLGKPFNLKMTKVSFTGEDMLIEAKFIHT
ncbi:MAG: bifunctional diaminohydroxyphosphoribosylaminopyrimidine deaminase/5-amino-6-(5-phosphoribosylamino)uracil reductase RibD [Bacteroidota bacterium]|jgi:diaminohydroxyphosphoribosylaminopyrimidine deaminase/5-amino-6-(5-phosphoribosylamino)uracil reductase